MQQPTSNDVVVTGLGAVTSIGVGAVALWSALMDGRSNIGLRSLQVDLGRTVELPVASMPPDLDVPGLDKHRQFLAAQDAEGYRDLGYAMLAAEQALADARLSYDRESNRVGAIQVFEAPGVERTVTQLFGLFSGPMPADQGPPPVYDLLAGRFYNMQPFVYVHLLGKAFGFKGFSTSVHNACTSGAFAIELAAGLIRSGKADAMIVAGGEAFDTGVRLEWFRRLDLYCRDDRMRPFDSQSSGFFVGEGGGALVLESAARAAERGAAPYAAYLGGAFAQQSWKQVIPDVRAARLRDVISAAMKETGVGPEELDLIVPHGAATQLSDGYEAACLAQALRGARNDAVATAFKPYVGHFLASSSVIETVCALLAMKHQRVPPVLHTDPQRVQFPVPMATATSGESEAEARRTASAQTPAPRPVRTAMKLSTGFTGHDAALIFRRP